MDVRGLVSRSSLAGYEHPIDQVVRDLLQCLDKPSLALLHWQEVFSVVQVLVFPFRLQATSFLHLMWKKLKSEGCIWLLTDLSKRRDGTMRLPRAWGKRTLSPKP